MSGPASGVVIELSTGAGVSVTGSLADVETALSDAARSALGRLAWFDEADGGRVGVNPAHVVAVRPGDAPAA
jgi:hypothetical protein